MKIFIITIIIMFFIALITFCILVHNIRYVKKLEALSKQTVIVRSFNNPNLLYYCDICGKNSINMNLINTPEMSIMCCNDCLNYVIDEKSNNIIYKKL